MKRENEETPEPAATGNSVSPSEIDGLEQLVDRIHDIDGDHDPVDLEAVLQQIGPRSFGTILLFAGIVVLVPLIGDIPGVPTMFAVLVAITSVQLLAGRQHFWLPGFLLNRSISRARLEKAVKFVRKPARFADRLTRRRLEFFVNQTGTRIVGTATLGLALVMPILELIPFSANLAGIALCSFGVSLIARDGLFALISLLTTAGVFVVAGYWLAQI